MRNRVKVFAIFGALVLVLSGCSKSTNSSASAVPDIPMAKSVGNGEGTLNIIAWAGYAEDGSTDKKVDWVTPFEKATGCQVNVKIGNTSDEMVTLMKTGQYDGVSASIERNLIGRVIRQLRNPLCKHPRAGAKCRSSRSTVLCAL